MRTFHADSGRIWRGGQRQCHFLCRHLVAKGHETHLVVQPGSELEQRSSGLRCTPIRMHGELDLPAVARLAGLLRRVKPDLAAAHDAHAMSLLALARRWARLRIPVVFHRRVDVPLGRGWASRWKARQAARVICVSGRIAEIVREGGVEPDRIRVVHSGTPGIEADEDAGAALRQSLGIQPGATVLGTVSGLIVHKGHADLLAALDQLNADRRDLYLLVAGDGPLREKLEDDARERGLDHRVHFLGEVTDLGGLFGAIDLFVHPSLSEGLGSSIIDAFAAGVPVVATRAGGIPELVREEETGFLADPGAPASLADAIDRALCDPDERARRMAGARTFHHKHLTAETMAEATIGCYLELLADGAPI